MFTASKGSRFYINFYQVKKRDIWTIASGYLKNKLERNRLKLGWFTLSNFVYFFSKIVAFKKSKHLPNNEKTREINKRNNLGTEKREILS